MRYIVFPNQIDAPNMYYSHSRLAALLACSFAALFITGCACSDFKRDRFEFNSDQLTIDPPGTEWVFEGDDGSTITLALLSVEHDWYKNDNHKCGIQEGPNRPLQLRAAP